MNESIGDLTPQPLDSREHKLNYWLQRTIAERKNVWRPSNADNFYEWHGVDELLAIIDAAAEAMS